MTGALTCPCSAPCAPGGCPEQDGGLSGHPPQGPNSRRGSLLAHLALVSDWPSSVTCSLLNPGRHALVGLLLAGDKWGPQWAVGDTEAMRPSSLCHRPCPPQAWWPCPPAGCGVGGPETSGDGLVLWFQVTE